MATHGLKGGVTNYLLSGMILQVNNTNFYEESLGLVQAGTTTCRIAESPDVWKEIPQKSPTKSLEATKLLYHDLTTRARIP